MAIVFSMLFVHLIVSQQLTRASELPAYKAAGGMDGMGGMGGR